MKGLRYDPQQQEAIFFPQQQHHHQQQHQPLPLPCHGQQGPLPFPPPPELTLSPEEFHSFVDVMQVQRLMSLTVEHPQYKEAYNFRSWEEGWVQVESNIEPCSWQRLISLDCEMVGCGSEEQIVQVCAIDRDFQVLVDTIVRPSKPVLEYRTEIHGVTPERMQNSAITQEMAQALVLDLLIPGTILVGHGLSNDLKALKIDYRRVIDTALIFHCPQTGSQLLGLNRLCMMKLGYGIRSPNTTHNCVDDAVAPMNLILCVLYHGFQELEVSEDKNRLFVHVIPPGVTSEDLRTMFKTFACKVQDIRRTARNGTSIVEFPSAADANEAFIALPGGYGKDSFDRPQKTVSLHQKMKLKVRKMSSMYDLNLIRCRI